LELDREKGDWEKKTTEKKNGPQTKSRHKRREGMRGKRKRD